MLRIHRTLIGLMAAAMLAVSWPATAQNGDAVGVPSTDAIEITSASDQMIPVTLPLDKARVVRLPVDVRDVIATNEEVADVIVKTPRLIYLLGNRIGATNVLFLDAGGQEIARLDISVEVDLSSLDRMLDLLMPDEEIRVVSVNENVALTGTVSTSEVSANALLIAQRFVPEENVVNLLSVRNEQQVLLKVRFAEVSRDAVKNLGLDTTFVANATDLSFGIQGLGGLGDAFGSAVLNEGGSNPLQVALDALERNNLVRTLAEPSVTAISGEPASVLVGGEFPIPVEAEEGQVTFEFRQFGVVLEFMPIVLGPGRISLRVNAEVSAVSQQNAVTVQGFQVPGLNVRRTSTSVDLPSGGTLVIAGLIQNNITSQIEGLPGLMDVPVLGSLFRSSRFQRNETELIVTVTPYLVRPFATSEAAYPTDGLIPPSDVEMYFMGRLYTVYGGRLETPDPDEVEVPLGFIVQ